MENGWKRSILDAWLGPEFIFAERGNPVLEIQTEIASWQQIKVVSFMNDFVIGVTKTLQKLSGKVKK